MNVHKIEIRKLRIVIGFLSAVFLCASCAPDTYVYSSLPPSPTLKAINDPVIEHGEPYAVIDGIGWFWGIPSKIILWNINIDDHFISPEMDKVITEYLEKNQLQDVKVRVNQYSPGAEWTRLVENDQMSGFWRYTIGVISWLGYTILPGRIFGGDNYNPFTNTISLYSDHPAVALHEMGHAKDFAAKEYKGWNAVLRLLPIVPLFQEGAATSDALGYLEANTCRESEKDAYKVLYPAFFTYIGGEILIWVPGGSWIIAAAAIPGHIAGRVQAARTEPLPGEQCQVKVLKPRPTPCEEGESTEQSTDEPKFESTDPNSEEPAK